MPITATFSTCAYDPATGEVGVGVQSKYFAVGAIVPWVAADAGAIATQAWANTGFGWRGLQMIREGVAPEAIIGRLLDGDERPSYRQVGIVDLQGRVANYTGEDCQEWAGAATGERFTCQGNLLTGPEVVEGMARAMAESEGEPLAERLMGSLEAGQAAGGDRRGQQSAAIVIAVAGRGEPGFDDKRLNLRVDDHPAPIAELRRLVEIAREAGAIPARG
ncbi:MAG TPA: DUF1028 domain-containing protein [Armatimonadota bacterium]|nr:DUF1028 domain-containing protein [Armatimonadota bacterium]